MIFYEHPQEAVEFTAVSLILASRVWSYKLRKTDGEKASGRSSNPSHD